MEKSLNGHSEHIKERNIAVEVFGKREDYDPQEESTVRVAAGEVRKRLSLAYQADFGDGVRIELPVGSYCPRFTIHVDAVEPLHEPLVALAVPIVRRKLNGLFRFALCALVGALILVISLTFRRPEQPLDRIWNEFSRHAQPVLLVLPTPPVFVTKDPAKWSAAQSGQRPLFSEFDPKGGSYTGVGAGLGAARFAEQLAKRNQPFTLRIGKSVTYPDVQQAPSILFGSTSSGIGMQIMNSLRFRVVDEAQSSSIVDFSDSNRVWTVPKNMSPEAQREGYALITYIRKTESGFPLLIVAGLSPADTQAGAQFVTDNEALQSFSRLTMEKWTDRNFQLVLHEKVYDGSPDKSSIVSWHIW